MLLINYSLIATIVNIIYTYIDTYIQIFICGLHITTLTIEIIFQHTSKSIT